MKSETGEKNTYKLPRGERLRRELVAVFRDQRRRILAFLATGRKDHVHAAGPLPAAWPDWHDFGLGALDLAQRMTPLLRLTWDAAGAKFTSKIGLDPDSWSVVNPHTARAIDEAALAFCDSTNATTSKSLDVALAETRAALHQGVVEEGESVRELTKRVQAIFGGAEKYRARAIAQTETSRAVHAAQEQAAVQSGVVTGWEWLLSGDACPKCIAIAARCPSVRLGHAFAVIGTNPHYAKVKFPPAHPHCNCTVVEVLDTDPQPTWYDTLHQPEPATDAEHAVVAAATQARDEEILGPKPKPKPPVKPPVARKPRAAARPKPPVKPAPAPKPVKPAWQPGQAIDLGRPIAERIAAADHLEARRKAIADLSGNTSYLSQIGKLVFQRSDLEAEIRAYTSGPGANLSQLDPAHFAKVRDFDRRNGEILERIEAVREAEKVRIRGELAAILEVPKATRAAWNHTDGDGFRGKTKNVATRTEAREWLESKVAAGPAAAPIAVEWRSKSAGRAYASKYDREIVVKKNGSAGTMLHELGHHIEFRAPGVEKAAREFLAHRVGNQPLRKLRDVVPDSGYRADEQGRDDDFARAFGERSAWYVGKHYAHGSTEIVSMGLELLYNSPVHFANSDPEYFKFVLGILDGSMRSP